MYHHIEALDGRRLFNGGAVDPTFGVSGESTIVLRTTLERDIATPEQVVTDSGGRAYVLGFLASAIDGNQSLIQVRRLTREGAVDMTFNAAGKGLLGFSVNASRSKGSDPGTARIAVDSSDRLLVLMLDRVYRFTATGRLDTTFGNRGVTVLTGLAGARDLQLDADDNIWLAASRNSIFKGNATLTFAVAKLASNGRFDTTFDGDGIYDLAAPGDANALTTRAKGESIRVLGNGSVLAAGSTSYSFFDQSFEGNSTVTGVNVVKFRPDGTIDTTYGTAGQARYEAARKDVVFASASLSGIRADGTVVVNRDVGTDHPDGLGSSSQNFLISTAGQASTSPVVFNYQADQSLGRVEFIQQADGAELIVHKTNRVIYRFANGAIDPTFNGGTPVASVMAAGLGSDGSVLVAGISTERRTSISARRLFRSDAPAADVYAKPLTQPSTSAKFSVIYRDLDGIDESSINGLELRLVGRDGTARRPRLISIVRLDAYRVQAFYKVANPIGNGVWQKTDDGSYPIRILDGFVKDSEGNAMAKRTIGQLPVSIA